MRKPLALALAALTLAACGTGSDLTGKRYESVQDFTHDLHTAGLECDAGDDPTATQASLDKYGLDITSCKEASASLFRSDDVRRKQAIGGGEHPNWGALDGGNWRVSGQVDLLQKLQQKIGGTLTKP